MIEPGIYYGMSMADYLAIPALSQGPAYLTITDCPDAGWFDSYLNPEPPDPDDSNESDIGTAAHALFLEESGANVEVINPEDYLSQKGEIPKGFTNNAIRAARDAAREAGKVPILAPRWAGIRVMADETARFVDSLLGKEPAIHKALTTGGKSEVTIVWKEGDVLCKMRADKLADDFSIECNYKTTPGTVEPDAWGRTQLFGAGYYFGAAWYRRGIFSATHSLATSMFLAQSTKRPYRCSLIGVDPAVVAFGDAQVATAIKTWQRCAAANNWPAYGNRVVYPELPAWLQAQWEEREAML